MDRDTLQPSFAVIYNLPTPMQTPSSETHQREYPSLAFLDGQTLFVSDGYGMLYVLKVTSKDSAQLFGTYELPSTSEPAARDISSPFRIHIAAKISDGTAVVLLSSKHDKPQEESDLSSSTSKRRTPTVEFDVFAAQFSANMHTSEADDKISPLDIIWQRRGADVPIYLAYDRHRNAFLLAGTSTYHHIGLAPSTPYEPSPDELAPIPRANESADAAPAAPPKPPPYAWTQDSEELTVAFPLPSTTTKADMTVHFSAQTLTLLIRSTDPELPRYSAARLWGGIAPASSFWTWDAHGAQAYGVLTLHLEKQHAGTRWPAVFEAGADVPETLDPSELYNIRESLEKYTVALQSGQDASGLGLGAGVPSLAEGERDDEADAAVGRAACLTWVRADGGAPAWARGDAEDVTVLATPLPGLDADASLVVKHTIDGLYFTLSEGEGGGWTHASTYHAVAFVLASKRDTRFTYHVPDKAMLAFEGGTADYGGNLYIYRHARPKTSKWAKQGILKVGGGAAGSLLGVGGASVGGKLVVLCLCEGELVILRDILD
ncbi:hypothetical protein BV25DRAFT_1826432 [Artomyces pyxidatus]|uniref:Uncharacterized protein n=1 Tax=Artomyces pyxidatus TaxID=48021 RepID=A0ACB8T019_9AGAM|nr:hypothetical protein BV25DRAFT_1826432 [Artomyces pyxidatus]